MSDFHQHGPITTLHRLSEGRAGAAEERLRAAAREVDVRLVLPCHVSDLGREPLRRIAAELRDADWLREITLVVNGAPGGVVKGAPEGMRILTSDGPAATALGRDLVERGLASPAAVRPAKGWNYWLGLGSALAEGAQVVATHDADIASYEREMLVRLCLPAVDPDFGYAFVKGYYRRVTEGVMFGRVTRLFFGPLVRACVRVAGHQPLLDFLGAFRYPLAGECALRAEAAGGLPLLPGWGLETGLLCAAHAQLPPARIAQVELGANYDHKHRPLDDSAGGLPRMAGEVATALFAGLRAEGIDFPPEARHALQRAYARCGAEAIERHAHDALLNGLNFDRAAETAAVEAFGRILAALPAAERHQLPPWGEVGEEARFKT
ncbi:MAG: glycosyl transferase [Verrucomicrobia bacterium]|nr:glycosyl transferase [Verrucomicrobiota bacterium]